MKKTTFIALSLLALSACNSGHSTPTADTGPCATINAIKEARTETIPFSSLRSDPVMLGERALDDQFTTDISILGTPCQTNIMSGFFGRDVDLYTISCTLFEAGVFDYEENSVEAERLREEAVSLMTQCLGESWTQEVTDQSRPDAMDYKVEFIPEGGVQPVNELTVDAAYVESVFERGSGMRGGQRGWRVLLQFQEARPATAE
ncbi:MAG: lipoprotein [Pseudomonadota bacterium]